VLALKTILDIPMSVPSRTRWALSNGIFSFP